MIEENVMFCGADGKKLATVIWIPEEKAKGILQIVHGMTEHMGRYRRLADELTKSGIIVAGFDLRGHGKNTGSPVCASFGLNGWSDSLEDIRLFSRNLKEKFPNIPYAIMGFSLGSFLVREFMNDPECSADAAIILGTGTQPVPVLSILKRIVQGQIRKAGFDSTTPLIRKLSFEMYNHKFSPNRTRADWLCGVDTELSEYLQDPLCRQEISSGLFWQLLDSMQRTAIHSAYDSWPREVPVLLMSGEKDPVGDMGKSIYRIGHAMRRAGLQLVEEKLLPDSRHDILHDSRGEEVVSKIKEFLLVNLSIE